MKIGSSGIENKGMLWEALAATCAHLVGLLNPHVRESLWNSNSMALDDLDSYWALTRVSAPKSVGTSGEFEVKIVRFFVSSLT